jgi:hypothetical protein
MSTPEGKVKRKVTELLKKYPGLYYEMPVPGGYGKSGLDYIGCYKGRFFSVETKAPGKHPTDRQQQTIAAITRAGGAVFVIDGDTTQLKEWLDHQ